MSKYTPLIVVGIDPGHRGGMACVYLPVDEEVPVLADACKLPYCTQDPNKRRSWPDIPEIQELLDSWGPDLVVLERAHSMPMQGVASIFTYGKDVGQILGCVRAMDYKVEEVMPRVWQKVVPAGYWGTGRHPKEVVADFVVNMYPTAKGYMYPGRMTKPHDGISDAIAIATYGVLKGEG